MKLCKDCIYISEEWRFKEEALCKHPHCLKSTDIIDGQEYYFTCYEARHRKSLCGTEAQLFIPKSR